MKNLFNRLNTITICLAVLGLCSCELFSQNKKIDSLKQIIKTNVLDTNQVNNLHLLALQYKNINNDTALIILEESFQLAKKINWKKGLALSYYHLGWFSYLTDQYNLTLQHYNSSLILWEELINSPDKEVSIIGLKGKTQTLIGYGVVYYAQSNYPQALEHLLKALKIAELLDMKFSKASIMGNLGNVYRDQNEIGRAQV